MERLCINIIRGTTLPHYQINLDNAYKPPSINIMGTDGLGRDVMSRQYKVFV